MNPIIEYIDKSVIADKAGCTFASSGTGPLAPATKSVCDALVKTVVNEGIAAITAGLNEHEWTTKTYTEIIRHPFYGNRLSINDQRNFSEMHGGWFNINHNGMIYTERKQPERIKYLKTKESGKYVLYGNTQDNKFECRDELECRMYGSSGNDEFNLNKTDNKFEIADFTRNNDKDKLFVERGNTSLFLHDFRVEAVGSGVRLFAQYAIPSQIVAEEREIYLPGHTYDKVYEWVRTAKDPAAYPPDEGTENPIIIK